MGLNFLLGLPLFIKNVEMGKRKSSYSVYIFLLKEMLIKHLNADVNERSLDGESVLSLEKTLHFKDDALDEYSASTYHNLLTLVASKNFAHINLRSKVSGLTPLEEAVHLFGVKLKKDSLNIFRHLGAIFNECDREGDTILHYCVRNCDDIELIKLLVEYGCRIDVQNADNLCALCLAEKVEKVDIRNYFRQKLQINGNLIAVK